MTKTRIFRRRSNQFAKSAIKSRSRRRFRPGPCGRRKSGLGWWGGHFKVDVPDFPFYYLYALERFRSFHELATGQHPREPGWYTDGFQYLKRKQKDDGSLEKGCGPAADTAFAVLFLMRSTKKSIEKTQGYDAGMLAGGQGLPAKLTDIQLRDGRIVNKPVTASLPALLEIIGHPEHPDFTGLKEDPRNIVAALEQEQGPAREEHLSAIRKLAEHVPAPSRLAAVRALAKLRDMTNAPALIAALSDREWPVVCEADQGLRVLSRRVALKTVTELPDETARETTIAEWKRWYGAVNPE